MSTVPESHKAYLKAAYEGIYNDFMQRWEAINKEWAELEPWLKDYGINYENPDTALAATNNMQAVLKQLEQNLRGNRSYDPAWSWLDKAKYVIEQTGPNTALGIVSELTNKYEPTLSKKLAGNSIPATLSVAYKEQKISRETNKYNEFVYSLKQ